MKIIKKVLKKKSDFYIYDWVNFRRMTLNLLQPVINFMKS